ncbi:MAG: hypothetical protein QW175_06030 [Candidatus Bathyarchaeia archaeon]
MAYFQRWHISPHKICLFVSLFHLWKFAFKGFGHRTCGEASEMFEELALDAVKMLVFLLWTTLGFCILWCAFWLRTARKAVW